MTVQAKNIQLIFYPNIPVHKTRNRHLLLIVSLVFFQDVFKYNVIMCIGAGIGVTPFASILKSVW